MSTLAPSTAPGARPAGHAADWDFGDFPYGLEPLAMPPAGHAPADAGHLSVTLAPCDPDGVRRELRALSGGGPPPGRPAVPPAPSYDQLFWFRWITGHQVAFALWRLMGRTLSALPARDAVPGPAAMARLESWTHAYAAMLLYSGSCPRGLYQRLIRPAMFLQHRGFSGVWAPDFAQVRSLLRGRPLPWTSDPRAAGVRAAVHAHRLVHDAVADRLVPSGRSLLQQTVAESPVRPSERTAVLYDNFFMTLRGAVPDEAVAGQLLRRLRAVGLDLAVNGLYPLGRDEGPGGPGGYGGPDGAAAWDARVAWCERRVGTVLAAAADHAAPLARRASTTL
ncbi:hypothetical protein [Streptomyces zingiberis]|uniref:L-tyrosine 3-hydroxylase n=1 Tax=Streptomyces zingiberis TaxID=2053010 RepID=A0ABX1C5G9_9ACTN|nr:hypothetical protein [Streptomyces zingiberis]NJQ03823.1 hypothetical protein [Streptomyces zingiberis]